MVKCKKFGGALSAFFGSFGRMFYSFAADNVDNAGNQEKHDGVDWGNNI